MKPGIFEALRKYSPKENRDQLENFITEGFAWILNQYPDLAKLLLKSFNLKRNVEEWTHEFENCNCEWRTQENFGGKFPDMVCYFENSNKVIVFEHKTWSPLGQNQIEIYREYSRQNFEDNFFVLITATRQQNQQNSDLHLCWSDIYTLLFRWEEQNDGHLIKDFRMLLKNEGLGPPAHISNTTIRYYYETRDLKKKLLNISRRIVSREKQLKDWEKLVRNDYRLFVQTQRGKDHFYGRIGLELLAWDNEDHGPGGLFVGVLVDGDDHYTKPLDPIKGPDFCLIVSFSGSLHSFYSKEKSYEILVEILQNKVRRLDGQWQFYNHLADPNVPEKNWYHPFHIRKPLLDVFSGTETLEDQENRFYNTGTKLIKLVAEEESFWTLRKVCKEKLGVEEHETGRRTT